MVKIYVYDIKNFDEKCAIVCKNYFPKRFEKSKSLLFEDDKKRSYACAFLLYSVLGIKENQIYYTLNGKPHVKNLFFNLSHSGDYVILGVGDCQLGVDIEKVSKFHSNVAKRMFTTKEQSWLGEDVKRFYQLWTLKESVMKACSKGLAIAANSFEVLPFFQNKSVIVDGITYYGTVTEFEEYFISVCQTKHIEKIEIAKPY